MNANAMTLNSHFSQRDIVSTSVFFAASLFVWILANSVVPVYASGLHQTIIVTPVSLPITSNVTGALEPLSERLAKIHGQFSEQPAVVEQPAPEQQQAADLVGVSYTDTQGDKWVKTAQGWFPCSVVDELGVKVGVPDEQKHQIDNGCQNG